MAPVIAIVVIVAVAGVLAAFAVRNILADKGEALPPMPPSEPLLSLTEPKEESKPASEPRSQRPRTDPCAIAGSEPAIPHAVSVTAAKVALHVALHGIGPGAAIGLAPMIMKAVTHTPFTGADSGYAVIPGAAERKAEAEACLKVEVDAAGAITLDGQPATMAQFEQRLAETKARRGAVAFHAEGESAAADRVMDALLAQGVRLKMG